MKLRKYLFYSLSFLIFTGLFYILFHASIGNLFYPFAFSMMFALVWSNQKMWIVCPAYFVASVVNNWGIYSIISAICTIFCLVVPFLIHILLKKNIKIWEIGIYALLSQVAQILLAYFSGGVFYYEIISAFVGVLFLYLMIMILDAVLVRGLAYKLTILEMISGGVFLAVLSNGLTFATIGPFSFLKLFVSFAVLFIAYSSKSYYSVFISLIMGIGTLIGINNPVYIAPFAIWAVSISMFKSYRKILMPIVMIASECLCGFYFNLYYNFSVLQIIPVVASSLIFYCIPEKIFDKCRILLSTKNSRIAVKDVVNRNREMLHNRIGCLGEAFREVEKTFRKMANTSLNKEEMQDTMKREIKRRICETCPEKSRCYRAYLKETEMVLDELTDLSFNKGKISVLDIPSFMNSHCTKVTSIISCINTLCNQYKRYSELVGDIDKSKLLVAEQMSGVANIMGNLAKEVYAPITFDNVREDKIIEELLTNEIVCDDVLVVERGIHEMEATLVVRNEDKEKQILSDVVGRICGCEMYVEQIISSIKPGWSSLTLRKIPKYDCSFGVSVKMKNGSDKSGDCYSIQKMAGDKFMFALCDGMGSGEKAQEISENAINLIENFYKAGFDSELIMSSINKLLSLQQGEVFSAVDICILDLNEGSANFIKMGSPSCYVIEKENCQIIEGNTLPLGVIQDTMPKNKKSVISAGDYIILVTDGISDSFENDDKIVEYACSLEFKNPQTISDAIMEKALENNQGVAKDDMSVIVIKIF